MKKTFILLSIVFMIVMALASLSFANKISRNFNFMTSDPIITAGPPTPSVYGTTYRVTWSAPRCSNNQSPCVEGYEVMVDNKTKVVFRDNTNPLSNTFQLKVDTSTVNGSTCVPNVKHWIRVRAYNGNKERFSQNYIFRISNLNILQNTLTATVDDTICVPVVHIEGKFIDEAHDTIRNARIRVINPKTGLQWYLYAKYFPVPPTDIFPYDPALIVQDNINTTIPLTGISWTKSRIELEVTTIRGCQYVVYFGNFDIDPPDFYLTWDNRNSGVGDPACGGTDVHFSGKISDPVGCLDFNQFTYVLKRGEEKIAEGDVYTKFNQYWNCRGDSLDLSPGDTITAEITYYNLFGHKYSPLVCSMTVPPKDATIISSGWASAYGICDGDLYAWGWGDRGQLGLVPDAEGEISIPSKLISPSEYEWLNISVGNLASAAIDCNNDMWVWGSNFSGLLGNGISNITIQKSPIKLTIDRYPDIKFRFVSMGESHAFAIDSTGSLWGWGSEERYAVGSGKPGVNDIVGIEPISSDIKWFYVCAGNDGSLGISRDGDKRSLYGWGEAIENEDGEISQKTPKLLDDQHKYKKVSLNAPQDPAVGPRGTYAALTDEGEVYLWGDNKKGQLGMGEDYADVGVRTPQLLSLDGLDVSYWKDVSVGFEFVLLIDDQNRLWGTGDDEFGELGCMYENVSQFAYRPRLIEFPGMSNRWSSLPAVEGAEYSMAVEELSGSIWGWGWNINCQLGHKTTNQVVCTPYEITFGKCY